MVQQKLRLFVLCLLDILLIFIAGTISLLIRFEGAPEKLFITGFIRDIPVFALIAVGTFFFLGGYKRIWEYASIQEFLLILETCTIAFLLDIIYSYFFISQLGLQRQPLSILILLWVFSIGLISASRLSWRIFRNYVMQHSKMGKPLLIIGAGKAGAQIAKELQRDKSEYKLVGFIDDDIMKKGLYVAGARIFGDRSILRDIISSYDVKDVILAIPTLTGKEVRKFVELVKSTKAELRILPSMAEIINGNVTLQQLRVVSVDDLLGRDPVQLNMQEISNFITRKVVLVTGAGGSIGAELCRQIAAFNPELLLVLGRGENSIFEIDNELNLSFPGLRKEALIANICDSVRLEEIFTIYRPQVVFHAAAHKHVPLMEKNSVEALKNNIGGTSILANIAKQFGAETFVLISSDKAVNPSSIMGATKRVAEMVIQSLNNSSNTRFVAVRFGNVLGSRGSVIPTFKKQIEAGGPVTVTDPQMTRYFMTIPEASQLVLQAGAIADGGEIFVLNMGEPVKIIELARDLIRLSGLTEGVDIDIIVTGTRPGEKLYEEVLTDAENTNATKYKKIFIAKPQKIPEEKLAELLEKIMQEKIICNNENCKKLLNSVIYNSVW
ncbi:MAG: nucleoside-diphosphate sugar epimerase/dehydratase [Clostridia bacterium]